MCCLFGVLDYKKSLNQKQINSILSILSTACEARGTDATGISYSFNHKLCVFKRPLPAHKMHFRIPKGVHCVMGHTRMTTQGNEKYNFNNHPFIGKADNTDFALAHNGVIYNDEVLKTKENLPNSIIETDSYVAVQLIEKKRTLSTDSLKYMAEQLEGSFTITVMDTNDTLHFVKGDNPMCIYHFKNLGVYIYASTEEILLKALSRLRIKLGRYEKINITCGEILTIDKCGNISKSAFETDNLDGFSFASYIWHTSVPYSKVTPKVVSSYKDEYIEILKSEVEFLGYSSSLVDTLLADGFTTDDIEEMIYCSAY